MNIEITPEIIKWIEDSKEVLLKEKKKYRFFSPGFKQVVAAYDKEMGDKTIKWGAGK